MHIPCVVEEDGQSGKLLHPTILLPHLRQLHFTHLHSLGCNAVQESLTEVKTMEIFSVIFRPELRPLPLKVIHYMRIPVIHSSQGRLCRLLHYQRILQ